MNNEIWKDIKGYEGLYQISNLGRVKSYKRNNIILKPGKTKRGYMVVSLCSKKSIKKVYIHRLVAQSFIKNINSFEQVNHIDGDKANNKVDNLEWVSAKDNVIHAYKNNLMIGRKTMIYQFDKKNNLINTYESISQASKELKIPEPVISMCANGKRDHKQWIFKK